MRRAHNISMNYLVKEKYHRFTSGDIKVVHIIVKSFSRA